MGVYVQSYFYCPHCYNKMLMTVETNFEFCPNCTYDPNAADARKKLEESEVEAILLSLFERQCGRALSGILKTMGEREGKYQDKMYAIFMESLDRWFPNCQ
jgi:hypothetical protein